VRTDTLAHLLDQLVPWERARTEYRFDSTRRWRFDLAWPEHRVALEIEGGVWTRGRHTRPTGYIGDLRKYNAATARGWRVLRVTWADVRQDLLGIARLVATAMGQDREEVDGK
jgi:very-short-patch-repair endonuclease